MKPNNDSEKPWKVISSEYLHKNLWLTVRKDHVVLPNGNHIPSYYILEYPNWVNTIAITRDGQFVFIRQYRHGLQKTSYELCNQPHFVCYFHFIFIEHSQFTSAIILQREHLAKNVV